MVTDPSVWRDDDVRECPDRTYMAMAASRLKGRRDSSSVRISELHFRNPTAFISEFFKGPSVHSSRLGSIFSRVE